MKCPSCGNQLKKISVKIEGAGTKAASYQCGKCGYFEFEDASIQKVIRSLS